MVFSVVVPVCNERDFLRECADSLLCQRFTDFEVILVDDGSTDGSGEICDEYASRDERVRVIHKENGGQASARNAGVAACSGEYVVFLDSDDFVCDADFLTALNEAFSGGADIAAFRYYKYYSPDRKVCTPSLCGLSGLEKYELVRELVRRDAFFCSCWSKSVRRSVLTDGGIVFDESLSCEDMDWYYNVVREAKTMTVVDRAFICYRQHEGSVTSASGDRNIADYLTTLHRWKGRFEAIEDAGERETMLSSLGKLYCNLLILYSRHFKDARRFRGEIGSLKPLLRHRLNPRTKKIYVFARVFGIENTCKLIRSIDRRRG